MDDHVKFSKTMLRYERAQSRNWEREREKEPIFVSKHSNQPSKSLSVEYFDKLQKVIFAKKNLLLNIKSIPENILSQWSNVI